MSRSHGSVRVWAWSPDGERILFAGDTARTAQLDWFVYHVAGDRIDRLTTDLQCLPEAGFPTILGPSQPVWLDDNTALFHASRAGESGHYTFDVETGEVNLEHATQAMGS